MTTNASGAIDAAGPSEHAAGEPEEPVFLEIAGIDGSALRATFGGLTLVASASGAPSERHWPYAELGSLRLDAYGPIGVIRANLRSTDGTLPLLLLEPDQIASARRSLELVSNLMASGRIMEQTA